jgi:acyl carrier protein
MTTQTIEQIEQRVLDTLAEFAAKPSAINREATLEQLDVDSLDLVELGQLLHEEFGLALEPKDFEGVQTVGDALRVIESRAQV